MKIIKMTINELIYILCMLKKKYGNLKIEYNDDESIYGWSINAIEYIKEQNVFKII